MFAFSIVAAQIEFAILIFPLQKIDVTASLSILNTVGNPPYDKAKNIGKLLRVVKKYERANSIPAPNAWFVESPDYDNVKDN